ncbi:MAG TPA: M56 family metallopeptidase, partial [Sediminibacterium sp.]|nr:M56 family metallopeptidase [Sediminibacterium sp.]
LRLYSLYRTRQLAKHLVGNEIRLYHLPGGTAPFSFGNSIYLDTQLYNDQELEKIIEHELVHVQQQHTADMLLGEILCILQWYNPFAWMLKNAIRENLEFVADDGVLQKGIGRKHYQYLLLKLTGAISHMPVNNLLYPSLKKRIEMMNRDRSNQKQLFRFLFAIPLLFILVAAFSSRDQIITPVPVPGMHTGERFHVGQVLYTVNDARIAALVQQTQDESFLKTGGLLSLALMQQEKNRLANLLEQNGYDPATSNRAIRFVMDSAAASQEFSVQVTIHLPEAKRPAVKTRDIQPIASALHPAISAEDPTTSLVFLRPEKKIRYRQ